MTCLNVSPDKYLNGIASAHGPHLDRNGQHFNPVGQWKYELREALEKSYDTDAHFVCYDIEGEDSIPLIKKQALPSIRSEGKEVVLNTIALDWDTPGHVPLTPELLGTFLVKLYEISALDETLGSWYCFYTSRKGCRLVYRLNEPVKADTGEQYIATLLTDFKKHGLEFDEACKDFTRRFRLPKVVRDGNRTEHEGLVMEFKEATLDLTNVRKTSPKSLAIRKTFTRKANYPRAEEVDKKLFKRGASGHMVQTDFVSKAKRVLKGTDYHAMLFDPETPFCEYGSRNDMIMVCIGTITPKLLRAANATCEEIFALLYGPLCQLEPDTGTPDWHAHAWNALQGIYEIEVEKYNIEKELEADKEVRSHDVIHSLSVGMAKWCDAPELKDADQAKEFVHQHAFASIGSGYYPITEDGTYSPYLIGKDQIIPYIRKSFLNDIIETTKYTKEGDKVDIPYTQIINQNTTVVQRVVMRPQQDVRGFIQDIDGINPTLVLPMYRRNPFLKGKFDPFVDGWLRSLVPDYNAAAKWIAYALAFEEGPICALSLQGPPRTGKKMLIIGLAECLETYAYSTGETIAANFNESLTTSPFLFVNEGWPSKMGGKTPSDAIKSMTAGDDQHIRIKYKADVLVQNPLRIVFTANDHDLLHELTKDKAMAPDNREALGERILHFDCGDGACKYLDAIGNHIHTSRPGARWVRGDSSIPSDYVVAKHFMWLYENRNEMFPRNPSDRYCVMGNCGGTNNMMYEMITQHDNTTKVIRAILGMVESASPVWGKYMMVDENYSIYLTEAGVREFVVTMMNETIGDRQLSDTMKNIVKHNVPYVHNYKHFYEISLDTVLKYATDKGLDASKIRGYRAKQIERGAR